MKDIRQINMTKLKELVGLEEVPMSAISIRLINGYYTTVNDRGEAILAGNAIIQFTVTGQ